MSAAQYDNQGYYEEEYQEEEGAEEGQYSDEKDEVVKQMPWMAIALMAHGLAFLVFAFIALGFKPDETIPPIRAEIQDVMLPPLPEPEEEPEVEFPKDEKPQVDPTVDPRIVEEATDDHNEDPTDQPFNELAPNPNADDSNAESPSPYKGAVSNMGLGGGGGGGGGRGGRGGSKLARARGGGGKPNHDRVDAALQWLADHQAPDGHWSAAHFIDHSIRTKKGAKVTGNIEFRQGKSDAGWESADVGLSGLSLLAFAGDGNTHREGKYRRTVQLGLQWTLATQDPEGCFGKRDDEEFVYNHAICAMAIAEIFAMSGDTALKGKAQRSVDFIIAAQNPGMGWRYGVKPGENDSSVTAWMVLALKSCKLAELSFTEKTTYDGANALYDKFIGKSGMGYDTCGYNSPPDPNGGYSNARLGDAQDYDNNPSMDACAAMVRLFTYSQKPGDRGLAGHIKNMIGVLPAWDHHKIDYYYWYYASLALFQVGGSSWETWEKALIHPVLMKYQRGFHPEDVKAFGKDIVRGGDGPDAGRWKLDEHGSWDAVDAWATAGGRVYSTAINALTLEVYYRYERLHGGK